ncbi:MAG TPA: CBS domain-containing protein [Actinomycetota bacterium]|nr:CBS domain-containing protein [Actinomycetota bacterium]
MKHAVEDVMTSKTVVTARESTPFKELVRLMETFGVSAVPIVDAEGRLTGIVSEADLMLKEQNPDPEAHLFEGRRRRVEREKATGLVASQLMTWPVFTVGPKARLPEAARIMHEKAVKRLPVVDEEGKVVGIVSRADLLTVFLIPDEEIREEILREVITRTLWIPPDTVRVAVTDGVVMLEGRLELRSLASILVHMVQEVDGVVGVDDKLSWEGDDLRRHPELISPWPVWAPRARVQA